MKRTGLFFGSFNPIHIGHTTLAQSILQQTDLEEILFVVSPQNPLKDKNSLQSEDVRLQMVALALQDYDCMYASDIEFSLPQPSYTVRTLRALSTEQPTNRFSLIIGSDNLKIFNRWKEYEYILDNYPIIVYPRQGDDMQALKEQYPQVNIVNAPLLPISSTELRTMIADLPLDNNPAKKWLNAKVWQYIIDNQLYS